MRNALRLRNTTEHAVLLTELLGPGAAPLLAQHIERLITAEGDLAFWAGLYRRVKKLQNSLAPAAPGEREAACRERQHAEPVAERRAA